MIIDLWRILLKKKVKKNTKKKYKIFEVIILHKKDQNNFSS